MSKKNKVNKVKSYSSDTDEFNRMIKVLLVVVLALVAFYFVFAIARGEISFGEDKEEVQIQDVEILAGNTFSRNETEYYVMLYDFSSTDSSIYANLYEMYTSYSASNSIKMYLVDLNKGFNTRYVTIDKKEVNISSIENLKVVNGTLVKVKEGAGVSYSIGKDEIKKTLFNK